MFLFMLIPPVSSLKIKRPIIFLSFFICPQKSFLSLCVYMKNIEKNQIKENLLILREDIQKTIKLCVAAAGGLKTKQNIIFVGK